MSDDMSVQINGNKTIIFTSQGISFVLDMLATAPAPWKITNPLINDIMNQLKRQELKVNSDGEIGHNHDPTGGGNSSDRAGGLPAVETQ